MRKILCFPPDEHSIDRRELSPLTYEEFVKLDRWFGGSDIAFLAFKRHNRFSELSDFNDDALAMAVLKLVPGEPVIDWSCDYS